MATKPLCSIPNCSKPQYGRGWCKLHWQRWYRTGSTDQSADYKQGEVQRYLNEVVFPYSGEGCLLWPFSRTTKGYASVRSDGRTRTVHRLVCERTNGAPPTRYHEAAHICGAGLSGCVAPGHLTWKTRQANMDDMVAHGHSTRGQRQPNAKLSEEAVRQIRSLGGTISNARLGAMFKVSHGHISEILNRKTWKHVA